MLKILLTARLRAIVYSILHRTRGKNKRSQALSLLAFIYVFGFFAFMFGQTFSTLYLSLMYKNCESLYFSVAAVLAFFVTFIGSVFTVQASIFAPKDNDLLLSMPIKPRDILLSRLISVFIYSLIWEAAIVLPCFVVYCTYGNVTVKSGIIFFLSFIFVGLLTLTISAFFAWILETLTANMKRKNLFTTVMSLILAAGYFAAYYGFNSVIRKISENAEAIDGFFAKYIIYIHYIGTSISQVNIPHFLIVAMISIVPFGICIGLLSRNFIRLVSGKRSSRRKVNSGISSAKQNRPVVAILNKEISKFLSTPAYILNAGFGLFLAPLLTGAMMCSYTLTRSIFAMVNVYTPDLSSFGIIIMIMCSTVFISACSVSVEGKNICILKTLPVSGADIFTGKILAHFLLATASSLLSAIFATVAAIRFGEFSILGLISLLVAPVGINLFVSVFGFAVDIKHPRLNADTEAQAIKQNFGVLLVTMGSMLIALVLNIPVIAFPGYGSLLLIGESLILVLISILRFKALCKKADSLLGEL